MAKTVELIDKEFDDEDLSAEEVDALAALTDIEGSAEARWQVHRIVMSGDGKRGGFLGELGSNELRLAELQRRFGAGKYRIKGLRPNGTYIKSLTVEVAEDAITAAKPAAAPHGTEVKDVLQLMQERDEKRADRNREMLMVAVPAVTGLITAFITRQQPQQNILSDLGALKSILGPPPQPESPMENMIKLMELGRKFGGGGDKESSWLDVVKEAVATAGPMLMEKLNAQPTPAPVPGRAQLPAPSPANPYLPKPDTQAQSTGEDVNVQKMMMLANWAREKLTYLATKAAKNSDPAVYADWLIDEIPDGIDIREFVVYLTREDWWTYVQQFAPAVTPYQGWFSEFRDLLIDTVQEMFADADTEATAPIETKPEDFQEPTA